MTLRFRRYGLTLYAIRRDEDGAAPGCHKTWRWPRTFVVGGEADTDTGGRGAQVRIRGVDIGASIWWTS